MIVMLADVACAAFAVWLGYYLRIGEFLTLLDWTGEFYPLPVLVSSVVLSIPIFIKFGLYRAIFRYSGGPAAILLVKAMLLYGAFFLLIFVVITVPGVPRTIGFIQPILMLLFIVLTRYFARLWLGGLYLERLSQKQIPGALIYGAGNSGRELAAAIEHSQEINLVGFLDDDRRLHGNQLCGLPIYDPAEISTVIKNQDIREILLALPTIGRRRRNLILKSLAGLGLAVRSVPSYSDLAKGRMSVSDIRELSIDDILGRDPVIADQSIIGQDIRDQIILVTGAGGSIGRELCRQIIYQKPKRLILFDHSEFALYDIYKEIMTLASKEDNNTEIIPVIGSVINRNRVNNVLKNEKPNIIFHSAAYKHVPLVEANKFEGIRNNVIGTLILAESSVRFNVKKFVLISTDKAVRPTNVMGASKRVAELVLQALSERHHKTAFAIVRFGNVLDSSGSVVPLFRHQIEAGGPVTVTHKDVTRYFMTISEAAQLVMQAGAMTSLTNVGTPNTQAHKRPNRSAPVYLLDMGEPVKIYDLACKMIELSGLTLVDDNTDNGDIEIKIIGLRPGEKLYEELLIGDAVWDSAHPKIKYADERFLSWSTLEPELNNLKKAVEKSDEVLLFQVLVRLAVGFSPNAEDLANP